MASLNIFTTSYYCRVMVMVAVYVFVPKPKSSIRVEVMIRLVPLSVVIVAI